MLEKPCASAGLKRAARTLSGTCAAGNWRPRINTDRESRLNIRHAARRAEHEPNLDSMSSSAAGGLGRPLGTELSEPDRTFSDRILSSEGQLELMPDEEDGGQITRVLVNTW